MTKLTAMSRVITIIKDINTAKWLNLDEAIAYIGYGSQSKFKEWRETNRLKYHKEKGKTSPILYRRTDLDALVESWRVKAAV